MATHLRAALLAGLFAASLIAQDGTALQTPKDKVSYAMGMDLGNSLRRQLIDIDQGLFGQGLKDALSGGKTRLSEEEVRAAITGLQADVKAKLSRKNKQEGEAFLAQNKSKEGVVTLPSGLQYKIITEGDGKKPTLADTVLCNYRGMLIDGNEFDSSYSRGRPSVLQVNGVIAGWTEALQLMPSGSKWQLFVPPSLAYAERGAGPIGPDATLVFEVELLSIKGKP